MNFNELNEALQNYSKMSANLSAYLFSQPL